MMPVQGLEVQPGERFRFVIFIVRIDRAEGYSTCTGRKRAVLIGLGALSGAVVHSGGCVANAMQDVTNPVGVFFVVCEGNHH